MNTNGMSAIETDIWIMNELDRANTRTHYEWLTTNRTGHQTRTRTRVKSPVRFITFLVVMMGLALGGFGFLTGINVTTASVTDSYTTYTVDQGDTLWGIASELNHTNADTRQIVHSICQLNDIQAWDLQPGMVLTVPADL